MANPNLKLLADAAKLLTPILEELVFVGGCTTALLITDKAAADVRATYDVDAIAEITTYGGYVAFSEKLKNSDSAKTLGKALRIVVGASTRRPWMSPKD